jgi:tetratricopeptide repeat protein 30
MFEITSHSGCLLVKEKRYGEACKKFTAAMNVKGYQPHLSYNIALCHYYMKQYALALKNIADIIEKGIRFGTSDTMLSFVHKS